MKQQEIILGYLGATNNTIKDMSTIKSGRGYQIGIVFEDEYGRQTPVTTDSSGFHYEKFRTGFKTSNFGTKFDIQMDGLPPGVQKHIGNGVVKHYELKEPAFVSKPETIDDFKVFFGAGASAVEKTPTTDYTYDSSTGIVTFGTAPSVNTIVVFDKSKIKRFKYFIKQNSEQYYNFVVDQVRNNSDDNSTVWLIVPSYEINKVKEGDKIILKKQLNTNASIDYNNEEENHIFKVLELSKTKPEGIDEAESYPDRFFIKIKSSTFTASTGALDTADPIVKNLTANQGAGGVDGYIYEANYVVTKNPTPISNALFLGAVYETYNEGYITNKYYFKNGEVIHQLVKSLELASSGNTTFDSNVANLSFAGITLSGSWKDLSTDEFIDTTGTVAGVAALTSAANVANTKPKGFYINYSSTAQTGTDDVTVVPDSSAAVFETVPRENQTLDIYYETSQSFPISLYGTRSSNEITSPESEHQVLNFCNAFMLGNGVESNRIEDDFNQHVLEPGIRVSTTLTNEEYTKRHQKSSLIYSGIFNDQNNINKLNEFNTGYKITKELNPEYGSIQKLHTRNTDLIALCEDKVIRILANKDALYNADGNVNLTATENVLGQATAYAGEFGISKNPESFAEYGYRVYFTDKARGVVLRLSRDGLTVISSKGMTSYFRENLIDESGDLLGSYDVYSKQYILTLPNTNSSLCFKEEVDGWPSRISILPDTGVSVNGKYYTCKNGELYEQHAAGTLRNNFYGVQYSSGVKVIFNQEPSVIKSFKTIGYEGTNGWLSKLNGIDVIKSDQQTGEILSFTEKEGKYYSHISGVEEELQTLAGGELDTKLKNFSIQGLGNITNHSGIPVTTTTTTTTTTTSTTTTTTTSTTTLDIGLTLAVGSYSSGGCTLTGTFGSSYTNSDAITLKVNSGNIGITNTGNDNDVDTTKSALAGTLTLKLNEGVTITATVTSGLGAGTVVSIVAPQAADTVINGPATAFTHDNITLTTQTSITINSYQWYKDTTSGFTPGASNIIAGEIGSTLTTSETTADEIFYKVKINGSADTDPFSVTWADRSSFTARYKAGTGALQTACDASGTTITIFANNSSFTAATKFSTDVQGNLTNFQQGTYSNTTNGTDNHYRFINSDGIPGSAAVCDADGSALQAITASACGDSSVVKNFNVTKGTDVADFVADKVLEFTATQFGHTHWVVTNANYTEGVFDSSPTLAANGVSNANTCITEDPPTLSLSGTTAAFPGETITLTATPSSSSQGGTYSYQFQRSTDNTSFSSLGSAIVGTSAAQAKTTTEASADTIYYRCVLNGAVTSNVVTSTITEYPSKSFKRTAGGDIAAKTAACTSTDLVTLHYDSLVSLDLATKFYTSGTGGTSSITAGTYSDGTHYGYVDASRNVISKTVDGTTAKWFLCTGSNQSITISGDTSPSVNAVSVLTATALNYTPTSFTWERKVSGGSYSTVQTGSSSVYTASESSAATYIYKVTATDEANVSANDEHTVVFSVPTQNVSVQACPGGGSTIGVTISNANFGSDAANKVIKLSGVSGFSAGSYKIINAAFSGTINYTTTASNFSAFATCCDSIGCGASIAMTLGGSASTSGSVALGSTVVLTASASGYTAQSYEWRISTDFGSTYGDVVSTSSSYGTSSGMDNQSPGSKVYKCTVKGTQSENGGNGYDATKTISWYAANPESRTYDIISYQSNCDPDDAVLLGTWTSIDPLEQNTVVDIGTGICFRTGGYYEGASQPTANGAISTTYSSCTNCQTALADTSDCTANFSSGSYGAAGTYVLTGFFGTSYSDSDDFNIQTSTGTVSPGTTTVSALKSGLTITATAGATLTFTARVGTNCVGTTHQTVVPLSTCNGVSVIYTNDNPASSTSAANDLCGGGSGRIKTAYMNGVTLAASSVVYSNNTCSSLLGGTKYITENFSDYYIWNGYTLAGPYTLDCP